MERRLAILLDGEYMRKIIEQRKHKPLTAEDVLEEIERIIKNDGVVGHELYRVFYYTADPLSGTSTNPIDKSKVDFDNKAGVFQKLIDTVENLPNFAVRRGKLLHQGWELGPAAMTAFLEGKKSKVEGRDLRPRINQKGVDLRIGLDIASLALKRLVSSVVLVAGDSDLIPAMKLARREGLRVFLDPLGNQSVRSDLKVHADLVL